MSEKLTDVDEVLFRQVHPEFFQHGEPTSQTFIPTPKDKDKLSVDRSALTSAEKSYLLFTGNGHDSVAIYGVTVGEFGAEAIDCASDPLAASVDQKANPAHAVADYSPHGGNQQKNKAKRLKHKAIARGQLHPPK